MSLPPDFLYNTMTYGVLGFGIFAAAGAIKSVVGNANPSKAALPIDNEFPNIKYDTFVIEALEKLRPFEKHAPQEFRAMQDNVDKLIGLQILVNQKKTQASFPFKAMRHYSNIEQALKTMEYRIRNVASPHFKADKDALLKIAKDYQHNITTDANAFLMSHRSDEFFNQ